MQSSRRVLSSETYLSDIFSASHATHAASHSSHAASHATHSSSVRVHVIAAHAKQNPQHVCSMLLETAAYIPLSMD